MRIWSLWMRFNLDIFDNEVFGLLGPNGAGKTTLIHILATLLKPTYGTALVNGFDTVKDSSKVRSSIGIVFQAPSSDDMLTAVPEFEVTFLALWCSSTHKGKENSRSTRIGRAYR